MHILPCPNIISNCHLLHPFFIKENNFFNVQNNYLYHFSMTKFLKKAFFKNFIKNQNFMDDKILLNQDY